MSVQTANGQKARDSRKTKKGYTRDVSKRGDISLMVQSSTKIVDDNSHPWFVKVIAILLILSITLLWIPFPVSATPSPVEQTVDSGVEVVDQMDGQNNFTPGSVSGQNTFQKVSAAFGN